MGPRLFRRGNHLRSTRAIDVTTASMGPRLFRRGNLGAEFDRGTCDLASMGPRLFRRGNERRGSPLFFSHSRFNGSTSFQTWKSRVESRGARMDG